MSKFKLNKKDIKILELLTKNSRMPLTEISRKIGLPISTIHCRVKRYVEKGVAEFTLVINPKYRKTYYEMRGFGMGTSFITCDHGRTELDSETDEQVCLDCGDEVER